MPEFSPSKWLQSNNHLFYLSHPSPVLFVAVSQRPSYPHLFLPPSFSYHFFLTSHLPPYTSTQHHSSSLFCCYIIATITTTSPPQAFSSSPSDSPPSSLPSSSTLAPSKAQKNPGQTLQSIRDSDKRRRCPTLPHCIAVPSAQAGLTSLFGMGRGGAPSQ